MARETYRPNPQEFAPPWNGRNNSSGCATPGPESRKRTSTRSLSTAVGERAELTVRGAGRRREIADLVRDRAHQHARRFHHRMEAGALAVAKVFARIPHHGGHSWAAADRVGGKPHVRQKDFAAAPHAF